MKRKGHGALLICALLASSFRAKASELTIVPFALTDSHQLSGLAFGPSGDLYVADADNNRIARYDGHTGGFLNYVAFGIPHPIDLAVGPDGMLYTGSFADRIYRIDPSNGHVSTPLKDSGLLNRPISLEFGPNGLLYVLSFFGNSIRRFDVNTGAYIDRFIDLPDGTRDITFDGAGSIYVTHGGSTGNSILRYSDLTGAAEGTFSTDSSFGIPWASTFGGNGNLFVTNGSGPPVVVELDRSTGLEVNVFPIPISRFSAGNEISVGPDHCLYLATASSDVSAFIAKSSNAVPEPSAGTYVCIAAVLAWTRNRRASRVT